MMTQMMKDLLALQDWNTDDHTLDRIESYKGTNGKAHFLVLRWNMEDGSMGFDGTDSERGVIQRLTHEAAKTGFVHARSMWARKALSPWSREWFDEVCRTIEQAPKDVSSDMLIEATRRLGWVVNYVVTVGHGHDDLQVRNNIGKACTALGLKTPVGFF
jgi:hypothetical protein